MDINNNKSAWHDENSLKYNDHDDIRHPDDD